MIRRKMKKIRVLMLGAVLLLLCGNDAIAQTNISQNHDTLRLTIDQALEIALSDNPSIKIAEAELERVDYLKKESWNALLPDLNTTMQYTNNIYKQIFFSDFFPGGKMEVGSTHSYSVTTNATLPIFAMGLYKNIELSGLEIKAALESARTTKLDLIQQVKNSFYGIVMMKESLRVLEKSYKNASESAENIKMMYEQGLASEFDKIRSDVAVRNILPSLTEARNGLELAKLQLKILLSLKMDLPIDVIGDFSYLEAEINNFNSNIPYNFEMNSSLRTMDIQLEKLNKTFELVRSQRLPVLAGFGNYVIQKQSNDFSFQGVWPNSLMVGVSLKVPIFNKFSTTLKEKETKIGIRQLELQKNLLENSLSLAAQNAINAMQRAKIQLQSDKEAVAQAIKGYEIAKVRYKTGIGTVLELNDSEVSLTTSELNLNKTLYDFLKAKNEFEKVLGIEKL